jgi:hypothetical protein
MTNQGPKGHVLHKQTRDAVFRVYCSFKKEADCLANTAMLPKYKNTLPKLVVIQKLEP